MKILQTAIKQYFGTVKKVPDCFTKKEYKHWEKHEALAHTEPRKFACRDCTLKYQASMIRQNRCHIPQLAVTKIAK